jgi:hypothetical protein
MLNGGTLSGFSLIPNTSSNITGHWNAFNLNNGTSIMGPAWTQVGTVLYNSNNEIGPFSDSNYFKLVGTSGFNPTAGPYTVALVYNVPASDSGILFSTGSSSVSGLYSYFSNTSSSAQVFYNNPSTEPGVTSPNNPTLGVNVVIFGVDSSGYPWIKLNNGTATKGSTAVTYIQGPETDFGRYYPGGQPATKTQLIEAWASSDNPTSASLSSLYTTIKANLNAGSLYAIPNTSTTTSHLNAKDLNGGTANVGSTFTTVGTIAYENYTFNPSVGPFPSGSYYKQTSGPFSFTSTPFTMVFVFTGSANGTTQFLGGTSGIGMGIKSDSTVGFYYGSYLGTSNTITNGVNIAIGGIDSTGKAFVQLNGGTVATTTGIAYTSYSQNALGVYGDLSSLPSTNANLIEVYTSTDVPTSTAFTSLYNQIQTNLSSIGANTVMQVKAITNNVSSLGYGGSNVNTFTNAAGANITQPQQNLTGNGYSVVTYILDPTTGQVIPNQ